MVAATRIRHLKFWFVAAFVAVEAVSFSDTCLAATSLISLQVSAVVQNTCSAAIGPSLAISTNPVKVDCQYGQAYRVSVAPGAVTAATASDKSTVPAPVNTTIVTVTY